MEKTMQAGGGSALRETIVGIVLRIFTYIILIIGAAFLVMPYLWMLLGSFKAPLDANALEFRFFPQEWIFTNYTDLFTSPNFRHRRGYVRLRDGCVQFREAQTPA